MAEGGEGGEGGGVGPGKKKGLKTERREQGESQRGEAGNENTLRVKTAGESEDIKKPVECKHSGGIG